jgi:hypothetical protein
MLYFDLLDDNIILSIIEINIKSIEEEIEKLEQFVDDVEHYWYYSSDDKYDYDSDFDCFYGM